MLCKVCIFGPKCIMKDICRVGKGSSLRTKTVQCIDPAPKGHEGEETACKLAWELLTTPPFSIDKNKLYVTYFSGAPSLSLPPDLETHDVWRKIGVPENRIFPAGLAENFWEMSRIGPCGPCTEILIDRSKHAQEIKHPSQLTELWNIVFIQYNRQENGSLNHLPTSHVDTGMGLERMLAVLLNKDSNYDTDLFMPLFETIHKVAGIKMYEGRFGTDDVGSIDTAYRKLADHSRMLTVAMADGVLPDFNPKLRRILRKALTIPEKHFGLESGTDLLIELTKRVAESLATTYPEIQTNLNQVLILIRFETENLRSLLKSSKKDWNQLLTKHPELNSVDVNSMLGITNAYKDTKNQMEKRKIVKGDYLPSDLVVRLFDTFGMDLEAAHDLGSVLGFRINLNEHDKEFDEFKSKTKEETLTYLKNSKLLSDNVLHKLQKFCPKTDDSFKYNYRKNEQENSNSNYVFDHLNSKLLAVIKDDQIFNLMPAIDGEDQCEDGPSSPNAESNCLNLNDGEEFLFVFDKTCFYSEAGGQESDIGYFILENSDKRKIKIMVKSVKNFHGFIIHHGKVQLDKKQNGTFKLESSCDAILTLDQSHRLGNMRNHTAVHILNTLLCRSGSIVAQQGSDVKCNSFRLDFSIYGSKFEKKDLNSIEESLKRVIHSSLPVEKKVIHGNEIFSQNVKLLPGEVYPFENIMVIEMKDDTFVSREACCGTHVLNTKDIEDFIITNFKTHSRINSITGVTGKEAVTVRSKADRLIQKMKNCEACIKRSSLASSISAAVNELQASLNDLKTELDHNLFPVSVKFDVEEFILLNLKKKLKSLKRKLFVEESIEEIKSLSSQGKDCKFIVYFLSKRLPRDSKTLSEIVDGVSSGQPVLICGYTDESVKAECRVPKEFISEDFNARKWMDAVSTSLDGSGFAKNNENAEEKFHLEIKMSCKDLQPTAELIFKKAIVKARETVNR